MFYFGWVVIKNSGRSFPLFFYFPTKTVTLAHEGVYMKKLILIFSFIFFTACSNETYSIYGEISSIEEDSINVGCSDLVRKSNNSNDDIGYSCTIKITDETIIKTQAGDALTFDELYKNNAVSVYFEEPITSVDSERLTFEAKEITVFESKE